MKYWVAYNDTKKHDEIVAFHEDKDVVQDYIDSVLETTYKLGRCKSSELKKIKDVEGLYLVKHLDTYVQSKFYELMDSFTQSEVSDYKNAIRILERSLVINDPGKADRKSIINTIAYLKGVILEWEGTIPDYDSLEREHAEVELQKARAEWGDTIDFKDADRYINEQQEKSRSP